MIGIYCIKNKINNKRYIGKSVDIQERFNCHKNGIQSNSHLQNSMKKYGVENFEFSILESCSKEVLDDRERYWIKYYKSNDPSLGYNKTNGGEFKSGFKMNYEERCKGARISASVRKAKGYHHSQETIDKIRISNTGKIVSEDTRKKISLSKKGKPLSEETRKKISLSLSGERNPWYGKTPPQSTLDALRLSHSTESFRKKCSEYAKTRVGIRNPMYGKKGILSPMYNRISITKNGVSKFIKQEELSKYLNDGWSVGVDESTVETRRKAKSDIYIYDNIEFIGSYELLEFLHNNGYPKISQTSLYKLSEGTPVKGYDNLLGCIKRIKRGDRS